MASVRSIRFAPGDPTGHRLHNVSIITAISQTGLVCYSHTLGYAFRVVSIRSFNSALTTTVSAQVFVGARLAASVVFTAATEVKATLSATLANLIGSSTEALTVQYTTGGSGALVNGFVDIVTRPYPMRGETQVGP